MREELGDIERFLVGERVVLTEWHICFDEGGGCIYTRHASPDVERTWSPERRKHRFAFFVVGAFTIMAMAQGTFLGVDALATLAVRRLRCGDALESAPRPVLTGRYAARKPLHVRQDRAHLGTVER